MMLFIKSAQWKQQAVKVKFFYDDLSSSVASIRTALVFPMID